MNKADDVVNIPQQALSGGTGATSGSLTGASAPAAVLATVTDNSDIAASQVVAVNAMKDIDTAIDRINSERATYGAALNRFDAIVSNLAIANENTQAARGRIMDADFATETSNLSRAQILQQAGNAMVAQANQVPAGVMALLKG
mgnify:CR=1 FL=1